MIYLDNAATTKTAFLPPVRVIAPKSVFLHPPILSYFQYTSFWELRLFSAAIEAETRKDKNFIFPRIK